MCILFCSIVDCCQDGVNEVKTTKPLELTLVNQFNQSYKLLFINYKQLMV